MCDYKHPLRVSGPTFKQSQSKHSKIAVKRMSRASRSKPRIDYSLLNSTGEVVEKEPTAEDLSIILDQLSLNEMPSPASINIKVLIQEVEDTIDENPIHPGADFNETIMKLSELRKSIRHNEQSLLTETPDKDLTQAVMMTLSSIKEYIKEANDSKLKSKLTQTKQEADTMQRKQKSLRFMIDDSEHSIEELIKEFTRQPNKCTDEELIQMKTNLSSSINLINEVSKRLESIFTTENDNYDIQESTNKLLERYEHLNNIKSSYTESLNYEIEERQVYKQKLFSESNLNICLERFSGYSDSIDFYTFKSKFEKLHLRTTPKHLLADLLKNNFLCDPALSCVKTLDDIEEIWKRLQFAYGDVMMMLQKKINQLATQNPISRSRDVNSIVNSLSKIINLIKELKSLAETHNVKNYLYYGGAIQKVYHLLGDSRLSRWLSQISDEDLSPEQTWSRLCKFLEDELKIQQQKLIVKSSYSQDQEPKMKHPKSQQPTQHQDASKTTRNQRYGYSSSSSSIPSEPICFICNSKDGTNDHVSTLGPGGTRILQYYTCKKFVELTPADRLSLLKEKGYCFQCLFPGADATTPKHKEGRCQRDYTCQHSSHEKYPNRKHVLVCNEHKDEQCNKELLATYKQRCIRNSNLPLFSRNISLTFHVHESFKTRQYSNDATTTDERGIYLLQTICIDDIPYTIFFDNGCSDFIVKRSAIQSLGSKASQLSAQVTQIGGVGQTSLQTFGTYNIKIPTHDGQVASLNGISLDSITTTFPQYPLMNVFNDIAQSFRSSGGDPTQLPQPASNVGGDVHFMIGIRYLRYHPKLVYQLPSGLGIYESVFTNQYGGRGVIGGPHEIFSKVHQTYFNQTNYLGFLSEQFTLYRMGIKVNPDVNLLSAYPANHIKQFEDAEATGSIITYRCVNCRDCKDCKSSKHLEEVSIKEEVEQHIIDSSVKIDPETKTITAILPFVANPITKLAPNKDIALKIYHQQLRKLSNTLDDKAEIIASESKLQSLGFVDYVDNLNQQQQSMLRDSPVKNFIPWRVVWKTTSISTPCRVVYDASHPTSTGFSLNDLLAKGRNNLNKLQEILIRWSTHHIGIHTDIRKMYNTIKLDERHWCYQRYIWQKDLDPTKIPREKIIKTLIYGIRSSGNQAEHGLRSISSSFKEQYPEVNEIIQNDVYVDDCITGESALTKAHQRADEIEFVLSHGDFHLKGITFSGSNPPEHLTDDGSTVGIGGMTWYPKSDELSINISQLNFTKKRRGKKPTEANNIIPERLTRRHCTSKVAEIFDLTGRIAPIVATFKLDLQQLSTRHLDWDDKIPDDLRPIWLNHFEMMQEISNIRFKRAIIPPDATCLEVDTIDFGDASQYLICVAIYARFHRSNGEYSSQLIFARTKVVPKDHTLPRAELFASLVNTHTGEVVKRSLKSLHKSSIKLTDSQIALYWISNDEKPLKKWVRSRVLEIQRFTEKDQWFYIPTDQMIADLGTRRGVNFKDIDQSSVWINGHDWMKQPKSTFPIQSVADIKLSNQQIAEINKEQNIVQSCHMESFDATSERYAFSKYLLDPNQHRYKIVIRIMAFVFKYFFILLRRARSATRNQPIIKRSSTIVITDEEIKAAEDYYFAKGSEEIVQFLPKSKYENITKSNNKILMYTGRILVDDEVSIVGRFTKSMKDLSSTTFCVPVLDRKSPIAYSIMLDIHWNDPDVNHAGIETTLRYVLKKTYIIEGRLLAKMIKSSCQRCKFLSKRTVDIAMGPISRCNITIAPAFFYTQVDLSGPYQCYSPLHKRSTAKLWLVVFCCCSTSAVKIKVMDDYGTTSFILAFNRFSCDHGYPKRLLCDEGSQLIKACKEMKLDFLDLKTQLMKESRVEFELCPVQGHSMHGKVERKIREINSSIEKSVHNHRLSILQWETLTSCIANQINNLPLAIGNVVGDFECLDLITPNRLLLGRNNDRCPSGILTCNNPTKIIKENESIFNSWFEVWLLVHVPKLMKHQKWFASDKINVGDIILFTKTDSVISKSYTYGIVKNLEFGRDGKPRKATIRYRNENEKVWRETNRAVRSLVIIHHIDDWDVMKDLGEMALKIDLTP